MRDVRLHGGRVQIRTFGSLDDIFGLPEPVVVNALGLGAGPLFADESLLPVAGLLVKLLPQPEVTYGIGQVQTDDGSFYYMSPRADGIVLGGTAEPGVSDRTVSDEAVARLLEAHRRVHASES